MNNNSGNSVVTEPHGRPISEIARELGVPETHLLRYGHDKAKIELEYLTSLPPTESRLVLVTAISPTPAGEGKTTTSIGLADGLRRLGVTSVLALREPSMGPVFGMKGGATGGGRAQLIPGDEINLHFTGDFAAIAEANNLLAAVVDNALHFGTHEIDPRSICIRRAIDVNDRALRDVVVGIGGRTGGITRESGFDITAASQIMATFCMAVSLADLQERLGRIVVGSDFSGRAVTVNDLGVTGALTAVLRDALAPNLVQTLEGTPAFVHGGPFANIAHGCNSVIATKAALALGDVVVTEAGFGADLGAEKFIDILSRQSGLEPDLSVVVATVRALKFHGGVELDDLGWENVAAVRRGLPNLERHVRTLSEVFGQRVLVAINQFASDTSEEIEVIEDAMRELGVGVVLTNHFTYGSEGAEELGRAVMAALEQPSHTTYCYESDETLENKARAVVTKVYGGANISWTPAARRELSRLQNSGWGHLPVCFAKTQYSFSTDPKVLGAPSGFDVPIREVRLSAGAGFVVLISGTIMTMPGLPKRPSAVDITVSAHGEIGGMH
ncbi:MAG: formate--tetrahydrofolate ligase [Ancrocorticia sp.]